MRVHWIFVLLVTSRQGCTTVFSKCDITPRLVKLNLSLAIFAVCGFKILQALCVWCFVFSSLEAFWVCVFYPF
jgi:hypothetical protein